MGCVETKPENSYVFEKKGKNTYNVRYFNGGSYLGGLKNGQRSGLGQSTVDHGETYNGEWKDDRMTGQGIFTYRNKDVYQGQ